LQFERVCPMCDDCTEIDQKIARYRKLTLAISDPITVQRIKALIEELAARKRLLHPDEDAR
jgi:hypothetical protein